MATEIKVPPLGESVTTALLIKWHKKPGDHVETDEPVCELETDKANVDLPSPSAGTITLRVNEGATVEIGQVVAMVEESAAGQAPQPARQMVSEPQPPKPQPQAAPTQPPQAIASPAAKRIAAEKGIAVASVTGTGRGGRVTKQDMVEAAEQRKAPEAPPPSAEAFAPSVPPESSKATAIPVPGAARVQDGDEPGTRREPMSKIRRRIAERLLAAQQQAAILTTFNEIDLSAVQEIRARHKERFTEVHGIGLGLMSFFVRATVLALREFPRINAFVEDGEIVYHDFVHMGIAVSTERGLAVPVLRNAQAMNFAQIEAEIRRLATAARDGKLAVQELSGGTFTITNGGIFGSLLSTPILNPPQSGILGMHTIQKRPVAIGDRIEIRPMMYVALSYDHRIVDGRESVSFLVRLKELLEDPSRLMLEV